MDEKEAAYDAGLIDEKEAEWDSGLIDEKEAKGEDYFEHISSAILFISIHSARLTPFFLGSCCHGERISTLPSDTASNNPAEGL